MTTPVLYHSDMSVCAAKVRSALAEKGVAFEGVLMDLRAGDAQKPEYTRLNPNQVVPTLVHGDAVIVESSIILEYIDDNWPQRPLRPPASAERARMRLWMRQLDDSVHPATGTISTCIAFRHQHLQRDPAEMQAWLDNMVDPARRERTRLAVQQGMDSPGFAPAVARFEKLFSDMDAALGRGAWLAGETYSLADIAYGPYMIRLVHLGFEERIRARPRVSDWMQRLFATAGYREGVEKWLNAKYLELFAREKPAAAAFVRRLTAT